VAVPAYPDSSVYRSIYVLIVEETIGFQHPARDDRTTASCDRKPQDDSGAYQPQASQLAVVTTDAVPADGWNFVVELGVSAFHPRRSPRDRGLLAQMFYGWQRCPKAVRAEVEVIRQRLVSVLREDLVGLYLHGSLAMGCFNRLKATSICW